MIPQLQYAFRNLKRNKLHSFITITGLSIALASVLIIYLFVSQEKTYNSFYKDADRIYEVSYEMILKNGMRYHDQLVRPELAEDLKTNVPQIEHCSPYRRGFMAQLDLEDHNMKIDLGIGEQAFFNIFELKLLYGNKEELLTAPTNLVLTKSLAERLLDDKTTGIEQLIGKSFTFTFISDIPFTVTGILEDIPANSSIGFEAIIPFEHEGPFWQSNNGLGNSVVYYKLKSNINKPQTIDLINRTVKEYYKSDIEYAQRTNLLQHTDQCFKPEAISLKDTYLNDAVNSAYQKKGNNAQLNILSIVGLLILFIALSNYIILMIGQFVRKAGEVSIRKSMGGKNIDILKIFANESIIVITASIVIGGFLTYMLVPVFNNNSETQIYIDLISLPSFIIFSFITGALLILFTSITPLLLFGKVKPAALASKKLFYGRETIVSQAFIGLQYTLAIILIISTIGINKQTKYLKNKSLGFTDDNIISVDVPYLQQSTSTILRDILLKEPGVINASLTNRNYFDGYSSRSIEVTNSEVMQTYLFKVDQNFIATLDLTLLEGRNFRESEINEESNTIIVNEEFVKRMSFEGSPIGQLVKSDNQEFLIIGVVKNYQFRTSRENIEPMMLYSNPNWGNGYSAILLKYSSQQLAQVISAINSGWKEIGTKEELNYIFWDQELENRYKSEQRLSNLITIASIIALLILTLGLFGVTVLITTKRIKEIGIRKVSGAKTSQVISLLNVDYIKWLIVAFVFASPIAWLLLNKWLSEFTSKTTLSWWIFILAGLIAFAIMLLTVTYQSYKAAISNPVDSLRNE